MSVKISYKSYDTAVPVDDLIEKQIKHLYPNIIIDVPGVFVASKNRRGMKYGFFPMEFLYACGEDGELSEDVSLTEYDRDEDDVCTCEG